MWFERTMPAEFAPLLAGVATVVGVASETPDSPYAALGQAHAAIAGGRLRYDAAFMAQAPALRVIARTGIGVDNVDIPAATARGIGLIFAVAKQLKWSERVLRSGETGDTFNQFRGIELYRAQLGLIGLGRIGGRVAKLAQGMGMSVVGFDPFIGPARADELGISRVASLETLLRSSDVVSIHVPLMPETRHLLNAERLAQMKPGAILINAARGGLVDEAALLEALERGQLLGAGLDVFNIEPPPPDHPLVGREDVVISPHIAGATGAGKERLWQAALSQAIQVLKGERPPHLLNPEVWPRNKAAKS
jgi:phosphoglycerate dehydrogenase-like enzyme